MQIDRTLRPLWAIGLKSDAAKTGVDAALVRTDGVDIYEQGETLFHPYPTEIKEQIESVTGEKGQLDVQRLKDVEGLITQHHIGVVRDLLQKTNRSHLNVDLIGFAGHTVLSRPKQKISIQLGDAEQMYRAFSIPVVNRFYQTDLSSGGTGRPIFPSFYDALFRDKEKPLIVLSVGGISSLTYLGPNGEMFAFEVGVGNLLLDGWMRNKLGAEMDFDGLWAAKGQVDDRLLKKLLSFPYLSEQPPKSSDRDDFLPLLDDVEGCSVADGAATLTAFMAESVIKALDFLPEQARQMVVTGGGAFNPSFIKYLRQHLDMPVYVGQEWGLNPCLDAQGFAFLAVRSLFQLPLTFPQTTGVEFPISGGNLYFED